MGNYKLTADWTPLEGATVEGVKVLSFMPLPKCKTPYFVQPEPVAIILIPCGLIKAVPFSQLSNVAEVEGA